MTEDFEILVGAEHLDMALVHRCLSEQTYWARDRSFEDVKKSFEKSLCFALRPAGKPDTVGFCRVVTDYVTFAYLMDVFVLSAFRNKGMGKLLLNHVLNYPEVSRVKRWLLATQDAHKLYEKLGFTRLKTPENYLIRTADVSKDNNP